LSDFGQREDLWAFFNEVGDPARTSKTWSQISGFREKWPAAEKIVWTGTGKFSGQTNCRVSSAQRHQAERTIARGGLPVAF